MMIRPTLLAAALALPAAAQALPLVPDVYVGVEAGRGSRGRDAATNGRENGVDYGAFAGVELPTLPFGYFAVEGGIGNATGSTLGALPGTAARTIRQDPGLSWNATARAGFNAIPGLAAYGILGYGSERVKITRTGFATTVSDRVNRDGIIYGGGIRYHLGPHTGIRVEYRKRSTDGRYDPDQILGGFTFRL